MYLYKIKDNYLIPKDKYLGKNWMFNGNLIYLKDKIRTIANGVNIKEYTYMNFDWKTLEAKW